MSAAARARVRTKRKELRICLHSWWTGQTPRVAEEPTAKTRTNRRASSFGRRRRRKYRGWSSALAEAVQAGSRCKGEAYQLGLPPGVHLWNHDLPCARMDEMG